MAAALFSRALLRRQVLLATPAPSSIASPATTTTAARLYHSGPRGLSPSLPRRVLLTAPSPVSSFHGRFYSSQNDNPSSSSPPPSSPPPPPPPPPPPKPSKIKFWPFIVVIALGSGGYVMLVNQRKNNMEKKKKAAQQSDSKPDLKPAFDPRDVTVVFVLGGPGAGKGTQCARLVEKYGFVHLSAGDLLRAEQDRPGSAFGQLIRDCIRDGAIVPMEVTVKLLENAMADAVANAPAGSGKKRFLIDGFPRKMDQAVAFEQAVCRAELVLFYDCPEAEMERRLLERGKTSGRADDNAASIRKRFRTFVETSMPVVDAYAAEGRVVKIDATQPPDAVFRATQAKLAERLSL